jgi:precorrin-2/cobalt-factor-2 C20-methyltransferase
MSARGKLLCVGLGPGDPELLTREAISTLEEADIILCPRARSQKRSIAREILLKVLGADDRFVELEYPMSRDEEERRAAYREHADLTLRFLDEGKLVVYATIGDPLIYSTFVYFLETIREIDPNVPVKIVSGISSIQTAAAKTGKYLAIGEERFAVVPLPDNLEKIEEYLDEFDTLVIMKVGRRYAELKGYLQARNLAGHTGCVAYGGLEEEVVISNLAEEGDREIGYLSTVIIRKKTP